MYMSFRSLIVFILAFAATSIQSAQGCRCVLPTIERSYHQDSTKHFVLALVLRQTTRPSNFNTYELRIFINFKGCPLTGTVIVRTPSSSAQCGVQFRLRTLYVLPLTDEEQPTVTSCDFVRTYGSLTRQEKKFLRTRPICCGRCACQKSNPQVNCLVDPCDPPESPPCDIPGARCESNYCGGCFAEWFIPGRIPVCRNTLIKI